VNRLSVLGKGEKIARRGKRTLDMFIALSPNKRPVHG